MSEKPKVDQAKIHDKKDFDAILGKADVYKRKIRIRNLIIITGVVLGTLAVISFFIMSERGNNDKINEGPILKDSLNIDQQVNKKKPIETDSIKIDPSRDVNVQEKTAIETSTLLNPIDSLSTQSIVIPNTKDITDSASNVPEEISGRISATPKLGFPDLYQYLNEEISNSATTYSEVALDSISIKVTFTITNSGAIQNANIVESDLNNLLNQKIIEVIENMPEWKPASINGIPINSTLSLPIKIIIK